MTSLFKNKMKKKAQYLQNNNGGNVASTSIGATASEDCKQLPIAEIIEKFQKIKTEKQFKPKDRLLIHKRKYEHVTSGKHATTKGESTLKDTRKEAINDDAAEPKRRLSLPSLFHPFNPITSTHSTDDVRKAMFETENVKKGPSRERRHSVSHVMQEYSKKTSEELEKLTEELRAKLDRMDSLREDTGDEEEEEELENYWFLSGEELHAFFNIWESSNTKERKLVRASANKLGKQHRIIAARSSNGKTVF